MARRSSAASAGVYLPSRKGTTQGSGSAKRSLTDSSPFQDSRWVLRSMKQILGLPGR